MASGRVDHPGVGGLTMVAVEEASKLAVNLNPSVSYLALCVVVPRRARI